MQPDATTESVSRDHAELENRLRDELRNQLGETDFENWFGVRVSLKVEGDALSIGVGGPFLLNWMQKNFRRETARAAQSIIGPSAIVGFTVDSTLAEKTTVAGTQNDRDPQAAIKTNNANTATEKPVPPGGRRFADLADFVFGPSNEMAFLAATHVCETPGVQYNPLFVHGNVGTGKTHLLEGIYRRIRKNTPLLKTLYLTAEAFTNFFIQALRERTLPSFRQRFRNVDVLLMDDVDFLESKSATQEEFLHTFQQLESHGRQVVLSSDRHPRLLSKMTDELTSRFMSGLVCRLESPEFETRLEIANRKADQLNADISQPARRYVAQRFQKNVRELEGSLNCLATYATMTGKRVGKSTAQRILSELERDCIRAVRIRDIETAVCDLFGVDAADLKSAKRHRSVSRPRMLAMFLSRKLTSSAYTEIGAHFGGRNHATVISAEKTVRRWLADDEPVTVAARKWPLGEVIATLEQQIQAS